jgi:YcxB-like protein
MHIEFDWQLDEKQVRHLAIVAGRTWRRTLVLAGMAALVGAGFSFAAGNGRGQLGGFLGACVAFLLLYTAARMIGSAMAGTPRWLYTEPVRFVLDADGITVTQTRASSRVSWEAFKRVRETGQFLLLEPAGGRTVAVPLPALTPDQVEQIRAQVGRVSPDARQPLRPSVPDRGE